MSNIYEVNKAAKQRIFESDSRLRKSVAKSYDAMYAALAREAMRLARQIEEMRARGEDVNVGKLYRMRQYYDMMNQFKVDHAKCTERTAALVAAAQQTALNYGVEDAENLAFADMQDRQGDFAYVWNKPNDTAFQNMVGFTEAGSPLVDVLNKHAAGVEQQVVDVMRVGVLRGQGAREIAANMRAVGYADGKHAELVARTETMRCYRTASLESYRANDDVVEGVIWVCAHQTRTCATCWAMDGKLYKLEDDIPNDHPNGRCTYIPKTIDIEGLDTGVKPWSGDDYFSKLPEEDQKRILGPKKYEKYKEGMPLSRFADTTTNAKWGTQIASEMPEEMTRDDLRKLWKEDRAKFNSLQLSKKEVESMLQEMQAERKHRPRDKNERNEDYLAECSLIKENKDKRYFEDAEGDYISKEQALQKAWAGDIADLDVFVKIVDAACDAKAFDFDPAKPPKYFAEWIQQRPEMRFLRSFYAKHYTYAENTPTANELKKAAGMLGGGIAFGAEDAPFTAMSRIAALSLHQDAQEILRKQAGAFGGWRGVGFDYFNSKDYEPSSFESWSTNKKTAHRFAKKQKSGVVYQKDLIDISRILFFCSDAKIPGVDAKMLGIDSMTHWQDEFVLLYDPNEKRNHDRKVIKS